MANIPKGCDVSNDTVKVTGAKGEGFKVSVIKNVVIEGETRIRMRDCCIALNRLFSCFALGFVLLH